MRQYVPLRASIVHPERPRRSETMSYNNDGV